MEEIKYKNVCFNLQKDLNSGGFLYKIKEAIVDRYNKKTPVYKKYPYFTVSKLF